MQERASQEYVDADGWTLLESIRDTASGYSLDRPGPDVVDTREAGMLENLPLLWTKANPEERQTILNGLLDCVYVDIEKPGTLVWIKPNSQFFLGFVNINPESGIELQNKST